MSDRRTAVSTRPTIVSRNATLALLAGVLLPAVLASAADWPQWRGPDGTGVTDDKALPTKWSKDDGIVWKAELPKSDTSTSSPCVAGKYVFVSYGQAKPAGHNVICFDREKGEKLWDTPVDVGPNKNPDGRGGGFAAPTPTSDGKNVFVVFGSGALACLNAADGKVVWRVELPAVKFDVVMGNSPILYGDRVILINDQNGGASQFLAFDKATGDIKINEKRAGCGFAHNTPILIKVGGKDQLVVSATSAILQGIDPTTGKILWSVKDGKVGGETASPAYDGTLVYADSGRGSGGISAKPGEGEKVAAQFDLKSDLGSAVVLGDYVYRQSGDTLRCLKLATGELAYAEKVAGANSWSSPLAARDGKVYVGGAGKCYVIKAGPKFEVIATNDLGDTNTPASAAAADGKLFFRGTKFLWCVGKK